MTADLALLALLWVSTSLFAAGVIALIWMLTHPNGEWDAIERRHRVDRALRNTQPGRVR